jgi:hypothetical protein
LIALIINTHPRNQSSEVSDQKSDYRLLDYCSLTSTDRKTSLLRDRSAEGVRSSAP